MIEMVKTWIFRIKDYPRLKLVSSVLSRDYKLTQTLLSQTGMLEVFEVG